MNITLIYQRRSFNWQPENYYNGVSQHFSDFESLIS